MFYVNIVLFRLLHKLAQCILMFFYFSIDQCIVY